MSVVRTYSQDLAEIAQFWEAADYATALERVDESRKAWPGNSHLHILWASLVQLQDDPKHTLDEASQALQQAIEFAASSPTGLIEWGHYLDQVEDDPQAARLAYEQGIRLARQLLIDALIGQAKVLLQIDQTDEASRHVREVLYLLACETGSASDSHRYYDLDVQLRSIHLSRSDSSPPTVEQVERILDAAIAHRIA